MKLLRIFILIAISSIVANAYVPKDFAINLQIEKNIANKQLLLTWSSSTTIKKFTLKRLELVNGKPTWYVLLLNTTDTAYIDKDLQTDRNYEYRIENELEPGRIAYGYNISSLGVVQQNSIKNLLLLVDEKVYQQIPDEINKYKRLLICDNYRVIMRTAPRAETLDIDKVWQTKQIVNKIADSIKLDYIVLFGRIPVAYSGIVGIDGHPEHTGAYPTDVFYVLPDRLWTDTIANVTTVNSERNKNVPNDGKFDLTYLRDSVKIAIGRIDFFNLPIFNISEMELYKRYISKVEENKYAVNDIPRKAIINDQLNMLNWEVPASEGFIYAYSLFGKDNIEEGKFNPNLFEKKFLMSFSFAPSGHTSNGSIISSKDYATKNANAVIACLFGSYFGDWDYRDGLMRSAIASSPTMLNSYYGGRPQWKWHKMNLGETVGQAYLLSINNDYFYQTSQQFGSRMIHINLMGDPTTRLYQIKPVQDVAVFTTAGKSNKIIWKNQDNVYSNVYRATNIDAEFVKLNSNPIQATEFIDNEKCNDCVYMVKALPNNNEVNTRSTSYYRESLGKIAEKINNVLDNPSTLVKYSSEKNQIEIKTDLPTSVVDIYDIMGNKYASYSLNNAFSHIVNTVNMPVGVYFIVLDNQRFHKVQIY